MGIEMVRFSYLHRTHRRPNPRLTPMSYRLLRRPRRGLKLPLRNLRHINRKATFVLFSVIIHWRDLTLLRIIHDLWYHAALWSVQVTTFRGACSHGYHVVIDVNCSLQAW